jgi:hypothetical protein
MGKSVEETTSNSTGDQGKTTGLYEESRPLARDSFSRPPYYKYCFCNLKHDRLREASHKTTRSPLRGHISRFNVDCDREYFRETCRLDAQVFEILLKTGSNRHQANNMTGHTSPEQTGRQERAR